MNLNQWHADASLRKSWESILNDPVTKIALQIAGDKIMAPTTVPVGIDLLHFYATLGAKKEGYFECLANLRALAEVQRAKTDPVKPFDRDAQVKATPQK